MFETFYEHILIASEFWEDSMAGQPLLELYTKTFVWIALFMLFCFCQIMRMSHELHGTFGFGWLERFSDCSPPLTQPLLRGVTHQNQFLLGNLQNWFAFGGQTCCPYAQQARWKHQEANCAKEILSSSRSYNKEKETLTKSMTIRNTQANDTGTDVDMGRVSGLGIRFKNHDNWPKYGSETSST